MTGKPRSDVLALAESMGVRWEEEAFDVEDFLVGVAAETPQASDPESDAADHEPTSPARRALARLRQDPSYYAHLREARDDGAFEEGLP